MTTIRLRPLALMTLCAAAACDDAAGDSTPQTADAGMPGGTGGGGTPAPVGGQATGGVPVGGQPIDTPDAGPEGGTTPPAAPPVPLDPESPWPKFRHDAAQSGQGTAPAVDSGRPLWRFPTGKGIFSSPVVGADETVYIGSASRDFYALRDGVEVWRFPTGEIIDSSALLDDTGAVYFGSGDGHLYALDAATGAQRWAFEADPPETANALIRWFEGNVAIGPDGTLYAGNDNFHMYALDRATGAARWRTVLPDQTWSLPALAFPPEGSDAAPRLVFGNVNVLGGRGNVFAVDAATGEILWQFGRDGSVAASPTIVGAHALVGAFDGYLRALSVETGAMAWEAGARDHLYASPAVLRGADGAATVVQPSADGTVYAFDAATGEARWAFDWGAPLRSSPALDPDGRIYLGTGDGHLLVLSPDGTLDWALRLITDPRDDLNASPALGRAGIYLAGESGEIFGVPYHYCHRVPTPEGCRVGGDEPLPADAALLVATGVFGDLGAPVGTDPPPATANAPLVRTLVLRTGGDSPLGVLDAASLTVTTTPATPLNAEVSANGQFIVLVPETPFAADAEGGFDLTIDVDVREGLSRVGLVFTGGEVSRHIHHTERVQLAPSVDAPPLAPGDALAMTRLAAPLPTLLPSYNQIGFDSLHYLVGVVEPGVAWVVEAMPTADGRVVPNPAARGRFPFRIDGTRDALTLDAARGVSIDVLNTNIAFEQFRLAGRLSAAGPSTFSVVARTRCADIPIYGVFIRRLGLCNPTSDVLLASGAVFLSPGAASEVDLAGSTPTFTTTPEGYSVTFQPPLSAEIAAAHLFALLAVDAADGSPLAWPYGAGSRTTVTEAGALSAVHLDLPPETPRPAALRLHLMGDVTSLATGSAE
jgi:outer membrane protein assembly factor BamB